MDKVKKAVLPAAGLGTRFLPLTKAQPKEMLPFLDKPVIQYVVEEAVASGLKDIIIVTGRAKRAIEDHFDKSFELEHYVKSKSIREGEKKLLDELDELTSNANIYYVRQKEPLGLGHAIACAADHVDGEPFAVMLADDVFSSHKKPVMRQIMEKFERHGASMLSVQEIEKESVSRYGIIDAVPFEDVYKIRRIVEKPSVSQAPSRFATFGRYVFTPELMSILEECPPGKNGEIQLADGIQALLQKQSVYGTLFEGVRYDGGDKLGWLESNILLALERPELAPQLREFLKKIR
ncbi:MAG: UTP--glucose-1-phosphate uridylyltransferase GalU [Candidatus Norongarragalinales archaeon]